MADQIFEAYCGFFDSVNKDRLYPADDMNRPYKRIVSNGVFATPQGTPSTDFLVSASGSSMVLTVQAGEGIFADKWFQSQSMQITVPSNNSTRPRIDSVIAQVDKRASGRKGSIVYRTGTPSDEPTPPSINLVAGVIEYRIANVSVASFAGAINNSMITDLRGSTSCPWVTAVIQQPDTSVLWQQWQDAYQRYYNESTEAFEDYEAQRQAEWSQFFDNLTQDLTLSTNVIRLESKYTTTATTTNIPLGISSYNNQTDVLLVFINGVYADRTRYYYQNNAIVLANALEAGQTVYFVVLKSIITGDISSVQTLIQQLENRITALSADSGWLNLTVENGSAYDSSTAPAVRCIGNRVYLRGAVKGATVGRTICTLPVEYRPAMNHTFTSCALTATFVGATVALQVQTSGAVKLISASSSVASSAMVSIATAYPLN